MAKEIVDKRTKRELARYKGCVGKANKIEREKWNIVGMSPELAELLSSRESKTPEEIRQELLEMYAKNNNLEKIKKYNKVSERQNKVEQHISELVAKTKSDYINAVTSLNIDGIQNEISAINQEISALKMRIDNFEKSIKGKDGPELMTLMNSRKVNQERLSVLEQDRLVLMQDLNIANEETRRLKYISEEKLRALGINPKEAESIEEGVKSFGDEKSNEKPKDDQKPKKGERPEEDDTYRGKVSSNKHKNYNPDKQGSGEDIDNSKEENEKSNEDKKSGLFGRLLKKVKDGINKVKNIINKNKQLPEGIESEPETSTEPEPKTPTEEFKSRLAPNNYEQKTEEKFDKYTEEEFNKRVEEALIPEEQKETYKKIFQLGKNIAKGSSDISKEEFYTELEGMDITEQKKKALIYAFRTGQYNGYNENKTVTEKPASGQVQEETR